MIQPLGREDPLEKEMATYSSILAKKSPWTEEPGGLQSGGRKEADRAEYTRTHLKDNYQEIFNSSLLKVLTLVPFFFKSCLPLFELSLFIVTKRR